jgi:hypothetical protein
MKKMEGGDRREGRKEELEGVTWIENRRREDKGRNKRMKTTQVQQGNNFTFTIFAIVIRLFFLTK